MEQKLLTLSRQRELIRMNQILAILVVGFAFASGYLLSVQEDWLTQQNAINQTQSISMNPDLTYPISDFKMSAFTTLLMNARYEWTIGNEPIPQATLMKLIWAAQGKITAWGERTVPSYRSVFPLTLIVLVRHVSQVQPGFYVFDAENQNLMAMAHPPTVVFPTNQPGLLDAPVVLGVIAPEELQHDDLTWNEAGGVAQNILLAAREESLITYLVPADILPINVSTQLVKPKNSLLWLMPIGINKER